MQDRFTSHQVIRLTGITPRQLQWWDERGVVCPDREGHRRLYSLNQLSEMAVICELRRKGFSLQKIRRVLRFLQREMGKRLAEVLDQSSDLHLVTDGKTIYLEEQRERIIDILKNAKQPMFLVCVSDQVRRLGEPASSKKPMRVEGVAVKKAARGA